MLLKRAMWSLDLILYDTIRVFYTLNTIFYDSTVCIVVMMKTNFSFYIHCIHVFNILYTMLSTAKCWYSLSKLVILCVNVAIYEIMLDTYRVIFISFFFHFTEKLKKKILRIYMIEKESKQRSYA